LPSGNPAAKMNIRFKNLSRRSVFKDDDPQRRWSNRARFEIGCKD